MARKYGVRNRMLCGVCSKDCAVIGTTGGVRAHKCPHGQPCGGAGWNECPACKATPKTGISANARSQDRRGEGGGW